MNPHGKCIAELWNRVTGLPYEFVKIRHEICRNEAAKNQEGITNEKYRLQVFYQNYLDSWKI